MIAGALASGSSFESRMLVGGENGAACGGNDEIIGPQHWLWRAVWASRAARCLASDRSYAQSGMTASTSLTNARCAGLAVGVLIELHSGEVFGDDTRRDCDVGIIWDRGVATYGSDKHAGVEDQALHGSLLSSIDVAGHAVSMVSAKSSSSAAGHDNDNEPGKALPSHATAGTGPR